jgi:serine/threonine protein phosphatase PrpC
MGEADVETTIRRRRLVPGLAIDSAAATHCGLVRPVNEDAILDRAQIGLWAVADGVGGADAGDRASQSIIASLSHLPAAADGFELLERTRQSLLEVNARLCREAHCANSGRAIASTVVCLLISCDRFYCLWAGDSRLYRLRAGQLEQISRDHSEVQSLVEYGLITAEEARHHPGANRITRAVGADYVLELECADGEVQPGDLFLLCSDGLTKVVDDAEIAEVLGRLAPAETIECLISTTLDRGAPDNVSIAAIRTAAAE